MKIPVTTKDKPYIEFKFDKNMNLKLTASPSWYGGKNNSFSSSNGDVGNSCLPKHLNTYIKAFKARKVKELEKEIAHLQKKLEKMKEQFEIK